MNSELIAYLLSDTEKILVTKGDKMLFDDIVVRIEEVGIKYIESFEEDIFEYSTLNMDEEDIDYIELFNNNDVLHFKGEVITKELWQDKIIPEIEHRLLNIEAVFPLTLSHITESRANEIIITISKSESQEYSDSYMIQLGGCGLIALSNWDEDTDRHFFSSILVDKVLDYLKKINFLSFNAEYINDYLRDVNRADLRFNSKCFNVRIAVGDNSKSVCNYDDYNPIMTEFENYIESLIFGRLKTYSSKPEKCEFCDSTTISDFEYSKPMSEVIAESENGCCKDECHCVANHNPAWKCEDCGTIYFRE